MIKSISFILLLVLMISLANANQINHIQYSVQKLYMIDDNCGWALSKRNKAILYTSDACSHWIEVTPKNLKKNGNFDGLSFYLVSKTEAIVVYPSQLRENNQSSTNIIYISKTKNIGLNWDTISFNSRIETIACKISRYGSSEIVVCLADFFHYYQDVALYHTLDSGRHWYMNPSYRYKDVDDSPIVWKPRILNSIGFLTGILQISPSHAWYGKSYIDSNTIGLCETFNNGRTWRKACISRPIGISNVNKIDVLHPIICRKSITSSIFPIFFECEKYGKYLNFYHLSKDKCHWVSSRSIKDIGENCTYSSPDGINIWVNDNDKNCLYNSVNRGLSWKCIRKNPVSSHPYDVADIQFVNATNGWLITCRERHSDYQRFQLWRTLNGGKTWAKIGGEL